MIYESDEFVPLTTRLGKRLNTFWTAPVMGVDKPMADGDAGVPDLLEGSACRTNQHHLRGMKETLDPSNQHCRVKDK